MDIENDLEYLYKNQDNEESEESEDDNIMTKKSDLGVPKTKRIKKKGNRDLKKKKVKLNIDFEEDENEPEKLKELETN